jgi:hypothetical protein
MTLEITEEQFTQAMRDAVNERGEDYRYYEHFGWASCRNYSEEEGTMCLVGLALEKCGVNWSDQPQWIWGCNVDDLDHNTLVHFSNRRLLYAAEEAQRVQDRGRTWGTALGVYERILAGVGA